MNHREIIESTARGLRAMNKTPDAFLYIDIDENYFYDMDTICGIPVFHTDVFLHRNDDKDCCFEPIFKKESKDNFINIADFRRAFCG